ncbi:hypothetical protein [Campylobacter fetus]|uniref:hypothetical protein n=1 Tax=Campylobacter fetus TaxID=196 RepID=UPI0003C2A597|nr:hypothetical protein [Campylobacter fetus]AGZ81254.1 hypothetical protein CFT03427_0367 [Campylobacter fetus subsp. testudinum 03-427]AJB45007.1 hypothetical protein CR44_01845 [Campylobacter fetus subsp. testudinum]ALV64351.1 hypothetical protein CFTSP3_0367 [Campylobacter fetus subsp. testudinum Sp3]EAI4321653.1 hypothetical protein [Campylobacter fetus]EAI4391507.1 hypothetical protein [Campylobacter fetus]
MKKIPFFIIVLFSIIGCANSVQNVYISTSSPIFITDKLSEKKVNVQTRNSEGNLTDIIKFELVKNGYEISDLNSSNIHIKANINYFRKNNSVKPNSNFFIGSNFGMGRHFMSRGVGFSYLHSFDDDYFDTEYFYDSQVSLFINIKNGSSYQTNLNIQSEKSPINFDKDRTILNFNENIAAKIVEILNGY